MSAAPLATQAASGIPPRGKQFTTMAVLVGAHAALSFFNYRPSSPVQLAAAITVSVCMVYFFWRQNIWARRLVLITAALSFIADVPTFSKLSTVGQIVTGAHLALAAFLLYWLNTRSTKAYFSPAASNTDARQVT